MTYHITGTRLVTRLSQAHILLINASIYASISGPPKWARAGGNGWRGAATWCRFTQNHNPSFRVLPAGGSTLVCVCVRGGRGSWDEFMASWDHSLLNSCDKALYIFTYLKSVGRGSVCIQIMSLVSLCCDVTAGSRLPLVPTLPYTQSPTQFSCPFLFCARRLCNELRV